MMIAPGAESFVVLSSANGQDVQQSLDFSLPENDLNSIMDIKKQLHEYLEEKVNVSNPDVLKIALIELGIEYTVEEK